MDTPAEREILRFLLGPQCAITGIPRRCIIMARQWAQSLPKKAFSSRSNSLSNFPSTSDERSEKLIARRLSRENWMSSGNNRIPLRALLVHQAFRAVHVPPDASNNKQEVFMVLYRESEPSSPQPVISNNRRVRTRWLHCTLTL
jgi:hypothetical protein